MRVEAARQVRSVQEPTVAATIVTPAEYVGQLMLLCQERRGELTEHTALGPGRTLLKCASGSAHMVHQIPSFVLCRGCLQPIRDAALCLTYIPLLRLALLRIMFCDGVSAATEIVTELAELPIAMKNRGFGL